MLSKLIGWVVKGSLREAVRKEVLLGMQAMLDDMNEARMLEHDPKFLSARGPCYYNQARTEFHSLLREISEIQVHKAVAQEGHEKIQKHYYEVIEKIDGHLNNETILDDIVERIKKKQL